MNARRRQVLATLLCLGTQNVLAADYAVQAGSGQAHFDYHVLFLSVSGDTGEVKAALDFDPTNLGAARGTVTVGLTRLGTGLALRDKHMRGALETDRFPDTTFTLQSLSGLTGLKDGLTARATANGTLTLHGVTRPLSAPLELLSRNGTVEVKTAFSFDPHAFGVNYAGGANGIDLRVRFVLASK